MTRADRARRVLTACLVLLAACRARADRNSEAAPISSGQPAGAVLRIADQSGLTRGGLELADELDTPYKIEWSTFPAGPPLLEAVNADAVDMGMVGDTPPVFAMAAGAAIKIVAVNVVSPEYEAILLPSKSRIVTVRDLKGKAVAVAKGSGAHHLLLAALKSAGMSMADIEPAYLTPNDAQPAFTNGNVDAWAVWDPYVANNLRQGARKLVDGTGLLDGLGFQVAGEKALADPHKSEALRDFLNRANRAQQWELVHKEAWAAKYAQITGLDVQVARDMFAHYEPRYVPIDSHIRTAEQRLADLFFEGGLIPKRLEVAAIFDTRFNDRWK